MLNKHFKQYLIVIFILSGCGGNDTPYKVKNTPTPQPKQLTIRPDTEHNSNAPKREESSLERPAPSIPITEEVLLDPFSFDLALHVSDIFQDLDLTHAKTLTNTSTKYTEKNHTKNALVLGSEITTKTFNIQTGGLYIAKKQEDYYSSFHAYYTTSPSINSLTTSVRLGQHYKDILGFIELGEQTQFKNYNQSVYNKTFKTFGLSKQFIHIKSPLAITLILKAAHIPKIQTHLIYSLGVIGTINLTPTSCITFNTQLNSLDSKWEASLNVEF